MSRSPLIVEGAPRRKLLDRQRCQGSRHERCVGDDGLDPLAGRRLAWVDDYGQNAAIFSLSSKGGVVYGTGYSYSGGGGSGNLEGTVAMNWADGSIKWIENCNGDTYDSVAFDGALYTVSHAHDCRYINGFVGTTPETPRRTLAFSLDATQTIAANSPWFAACRRRRCWTGTPTSKLVRTPAYAGGVEHRRGRWLPRSSEASSPR